MPLNVEIPLGTSPLCEAVIKILEQVDGLETVRVGPPVYHPERVKLTCTRFSDGLKLMLPINGGYRVFLLSYYYGFTTTGTMPSQLCDTIVQQLRQQKLPLETVVDAMPHHRARRIPPHPSQEISPTVTTPVFPIVTPPRSAPVPPMLRRSPAAEAPTCNRILTEARGWADQDGIIEGLLPRLLGSFGHDHADLIKVLVGDLLNTHQLEYLGPDAVTEPYQKYRIMPVKK